MSIQLQHCAYKKRAPAATTMATTPNPAKFLAAAPVYNGTDGVVWTVALGYVSLVAIRTAGITVAVAVVWLVVAW